MSNPYSEALGRHYTDLEMAQMKVRLVRLDAEGNPVDGSIQRLKVRFIDYSIDETVEDSMRKIFEVKRMQMTFPLENLSPEALKLLKGEE